MIYYAHVFLFSTVGVIFPSVILGELQDIAEAINDLSETGRLAAIRWVKTAEQHIKDNQAAQII